MEDEATPWVCVGKPRRAMSGYWCPRTDPHQPHPWSPEVQTLRDREAQSLDSDYGRFLQQLTPAQRAKWDYCVDVLIQKFGKEVLEEDGSGFLLSEDRS